MDNPYDINMRNSNWEILLKELIRLSKIERYLIKNNKVYFAINSFTYTLNFGTDEDFKKMFRKEKLEKIIINL